MWHPYVVTWFLGSIVELILLGTYSNFHFTYTHFDTVIIISRITRTTSLILFFSLYSSLREDIREYTNSDPEQRLLLLHKTSKTLIQSKTPHERKDYGSIREISFKSSCSTSKTRLESSSKIQQHGFQKLSGNNHVGPLTNCLMNMRRLVKKWNENLRAFLQPTD